MIGRTCVFCGKLEPHCITFIPFGLDAGTCAGFKMLRYHLLQVIKALCEGAVNKSYLLPTFCTHRQACIQVSFQLANGVCMFLDTLRHELGIHHGNSVTCLQQVTTNM